MDEDEFFSAHPNVEILFEAMFGASGGFYRYHFPRTPSPSPSHSPIRRRSYSPDEWRKGEYDLPPYERFPENVNNYYEEADKNARELIQQEEDARMKAEKKKAKKERQKQKKKIMNEIKDNNYAKTSSNAKNELKKDNITNNIENKTPNNDNKDTEGLDLHAAFMTKALTKVKNVKVLPVKNNGKKEPRDVNTIVKKAEDFQKENNLKEANKYYTEAIDLAPKRSDIILKRSYILYMLKRFEKSIRDAKTALVNSPDNPEAYLRIGEGNFALKNLSEAEAAFSKILNHNSYGEIAKNRLFSIKIKQLEEMGYHPNEAFTALSKSTNKTLEEAIEYLTNLEHGNVTTDDLYYSDEEDEESYEESDEDEDEDEDECVNKTTVDKAEIKCAPSFSIKNKSAVLTDCTNPLGICSLFIGNLKIGITQKEMHDVFIKFGDLKGIKMSEENQHCYAFANYVSPVAAGQAMQALQNSRWLLSTVPLIVKYPTNSVITSLEAMKNPQIFLDRYKTDLPPRKPTPVHNCKPAIGNNPVPNTNPDVIKKPLLLDHPNKDDKNAPRVRPLPKTTECFYWRAFGCTFGNKCYNIHIPENKGIDCPGRKPAPIQNLGESREQGIGNSGRKPYPQRNQNGKDVDNYGRNPFQIQVKEEESWD